MRINDSAFVQEYLARFPVDRLFSVPVAPYLSVHRIPKDDYLFRADDPANRLYFLTEGRSKTYVVHAGGQEALLSFSGPGTIMGDMELVGAHTDAYMVQAIEDCMAVELALQHCRDAVLQDAVFLLRLCRLMGNKLYKKDGRLSVMQSFPLKLRLAEFILLTQSDGVFREPLTQTAPYLGVSYRHLQRAVAELCDTGVLRRAGRHYEIADMPRLARWAAGIDPAPPSWGFFEFL